MTPAVRPLLLLPALAFPMILLGQRPPTATSQKTETERKALRQADRDFDQATAEKGIEGWVAYFAENGSMLPASGPPITGPDAIRQAMEPLFSNPDFSLCWRPMRADILILGVLGYTVGRFVRQTKNAEGKTLLQRGSCVSVWKKLSDGQWKIVLDTGHAGGPPAVKE